MPDLLGILETSLYVEEFERACPFYEQVLGLNSIYRDQRLCAYDVGSRGVLLLFPRGRSFETVQLPRRMTATGRCISPFRSRPMNLRPGSSASRSRTSPSKAAPNGRAAARASISAIRTGIFLSWRRPDCGRGIKVSAHIPSWGRDGATRTSQAPHPPGASPPTSPSCRSLEGRRALNCWSCSVGKTRSGATLCTAVLL